MKQPTARSLARLRKDGYLPFVAERFNTFAKIRQDAWGIVDIIAIRENEPGILAIQTTTTDNMSSRRDKSLASPNLKVLLSGGNRFEVWGWAKRGDAGKRKLWTLKKSIALTMPDNKIEFVDLDG